MKVAVLGSNGRVAHEVARAFLAAGHSVIAITRSGKPDDLTGDVEHRAADALKVEDVIAATKGADVIFNGLNPPYDQWVDKAMPMANNVMAAARIHKVPHLFIGNVYNFGTSIPVGANEATPFRPDTRKGRIRQDMEAMFEREARDNGVKTVILRAGDFYGTRGKGVWFDLFMVKDIDKGTFVWPGPKDAKHAFAYLPDLAATFVKLAEHVDSLPLFSTYHFEGHTLDGKSFEALVAKAVGQPLKTKSVPWFIMRLISPFNSMLREVVEMEYLWKVSHSLDGGRLKALLGSIPSTDPAIAIRQALVDQGKRVA